MTQEGLIRKVFFYTEDKIYDCDIWMRVAEHSDISPSRHEAGGRWEIYSRAQGFDDLDALKSQLVRWKEKYAKECEDLPNVAWEKFHGNIREFQNTDAELRGKVFACEDLLKFISELEKKI